MSKNLELRKPEVLEAMLTQASELEADYSMRAAEVIRLRSEVRIALQEQESAQKAYDEIRATLGFWRSLFGPEPEALRAARELCTRHECSLRELKRELQLAKLCFPEALAEALTTVHAAKERLRWAKARAEEIQAERAERREQREAEQAERERHRLEWERQKKEEAAARKKAREQELHRLRAIAAAASDKSRERADTLKGVLRAQFRVSKYCPYCSLQLTSDAELDHIIPIKKGGLSTSENLVFVCRSCNQAKGDLSLAMFLKSQGFNRARAENALERLGKHY
jgi:5-methylcytosine-specific restriction endonuclease McrA